MDRRSFLQASARTALVASAGVGNSLALSCQEPAPNAELAAVLLADGPAAEHTDKLMLFGRLVGVWDLEIVEEAATFRGTWVFGWVLQGRAIQDVLWDERTRLRGTTVRLYDPATDSWRITWFGPEDPTFVVGEARRSGEEIVIQTTNLAYRMRWIFSDVTSRSFRWRAEVQFPEGWRVLVRMTGTRAR